MKTKHSLIILFLLTAFSCFAQTEMEENTINFNLKGTGKPVVIFESGLGENLDGWSQIQDSISKITTTVSYDRLGLGQSSATEEPRTLGNLVNELNTFLEDKKIKEPYILVGHSLGGFIIRKFQNSFPHKILGLVLVDPSHEDLMERILATKSKEEANMMTKGMNAFYAKKSIAIQNEFKEIPDMEKEMKTINFPKEIPITLIASYQIPPLPFRPEDIEIKKELFADWMKDASQTKLIQTVKSGHYLHLSEPTIVIKAIMEMVENVKNN